MKKWYLPVLVFLISTLQSCIVVGGVFRAGFKMGIYSVFLIAGLIIWVIYKRSNRRR
ncbi:MAG: phosphatidate cytidylyltransferase [Sphingobacteriaceae bacterium]|nr:MAG: phosphatidate cytidylyltransferase [Sphingobacteriaceae bacterium]